MSLRPGQEAECQGKYESAGKQDADTCIVGPLGIDIDCQIQKRKCRHDKKYGDEEGHQYCDEDADAPPREVM